MLTTVVPRYQLSLRGGLERASWGVGSEFGIFRFSVAGRGVGVRLAVQSVRISSRRILSVTIDDLLIN